MEAAKKQSAMTSSNTTFGKEVNNVDNRQSKSKQNCNSGGTKNKSANQDQHYMTKAQNVYSYRLI